MRGCYAVFRKETANFFVSPIAYAVIAIFLVIAGFFLWAYLSALSLYSLKYAGTPGIAQKLNFTDVVVRPLIQNMSIIMLFVTPLLSMRLLSEEKKSGCIELLLTYPLTDLGVLVGKYLAALFILVVMLAGTFSAPALLLAFGANEFGPVFTGYLGLFLMGAAFISLGMFLSSLTENQIVAAVISFGGCLLFWVISWPSSFLDETSGFVFKQLSISEHLESFYKGILSLADISYFVLFIALFLFLTMRSLETYRWKG